MNSQQEEGLTQRWPPTDPQTLVNRGGAATEAGRRGKSEARKGLMEALEEKEKTEPDPKEEEWLGEDRKGKGDIPD